MEEILRYDISAEINKGDADPSGAGNQINMFGDQGLSYRSRGLVGGSSINGFQTAGEANTYNVERVGATRGPNAILFGTGAPGGVLNFRTRQPSTTRNLTTVELKVAGESSKRSAIDINRVLLKDKLGLRLMSVWDRKGSPQPHQYQDFQAITLAAHYRLKRDTELTVSYARDHKEGVSGRDWNHVDGLSRFTTALGAAASGTGTVSNRTVVTYGPDMSVAPRLWEGATSLVNRATLSTNASIFNFNSDLPIVDERFEKYGSVTSSGPGEFAGVSTNNLTAIFNHRWFSHVYMELGYNRNQRRSDTTLGQNPLLAADLNYRLPDGTLNPFFYGNGYYYAQQNFLRLKRGNDYEASTAWPSWANAPPTSSTACALARSGPTAPITSLRKTRPTSCSAAVIFRSAVLPPTTRRGSNPAIRPTLSPSTPLSRMSVNSPPIGSPPTASISATNSRRTR